MGLLERFRPTPAEPVGGNATQNVVQYPGAQSITANEEEKGAFPTAQAEPHQQDRSDIDSDSDDELVHKNAQWGVQKAEAMCQAWGRKSLYATYVM